MDCGIYDALILLLILDFLRGHIGVASAAKEPRVVSAKEGQKVCGPTCAGILPKLADFLRFAYVPRFRGY